MRWIGIILVIVLLVLSTGTIFAQETTVRRTVETSLNEFLESKMQCVVYDAPYEEAIGFRFSTCFIHKHELRFIPEGVSLFEWSVGYWVEVTIKEMIPVVVPLVPLNEEINLEGKDVVDASVSVYYRKWFEDIEEAKDFMKVILTALENKEKISIKVYKISFGFGSVGRYKFFTNRKNYYLRKQGEDPVEFRYRLKVFFSK